MKSVPLVLTASLLALGLGTAACVLVILLAVHTLG
jgi:hypothetical protein